MVNVPYPIDGTVLDIDGSTTLTGAIVVALNTTTGEKTSGTSNTGGQFILDLANFTSGYSNNDKIQITASYGSGGSIRSLSKRHTVDVGAGSYSPGNMVLHSGEDHFNTCQITFASLAVSSDAYVDFYDRKDVLIFRIYALAKTTNSLPFGYLGQKMENGFIRVFSIETSGTCVSNVIYK